MKDSESISSGSSVCKFLFIIRVFYLTYSYCTIFGMLNVVYGDSHFILAHSIKYAHNMYQRYHEIDHNIIYTYIEAVTNVSHVLRVSSPVRDVRTTCSQILPVSEEVVQFRYCT